MKSIASLQILIRILLVEAILALGLVYLAGSGLADAYPSFSHLKFPLFVALLMGLVPIGVALRAIGIFLRLIAQEEPFTQATVHQLRNIKFACMTTAVLCALCFALISLAVPSAQSPSTLILFVLIESIAIFFALLVSVIQRVFYVEVERRLGQSGSEIRQG